MQFIITEARDSANRRTTGSNDRPVYHPLVRLSVVLAAIMLVAMPAYADPPFTDAGPNQSVNEQVTVQLNGTVIHPGGPFSVSWTQTAGTPVSLSNSTIVNPTFTAPVRLVSQGPEVLTFQLTGTDTGTSESSSDFVNITVNPVNNNPNADAGPNQSVNEQTTVNLNGNGSSDAEGPIASFAWVQLLGTNVSLSGANTATPSFTAPTRTVPQGPETLRFQLTVTDGDGVTDTDTVDITVNPVNSNPTAEAGPNQSVNEQTTVNLNGNGSSDPDGPIASFAWVQQLGTPVSLSGPNTATPSFTAPARTVQQGPETLRFQLTVTDGDGVTDTDTVDITVNPANANPVANAGPDQNVDENSPVSLDGTGSTDSDGTIVSYAWIQTSGPAVTLTGANTATPTFTAPDLPGNNDDFLIFQLTVTDDESATDTDTVRIDVAQVNVAPVITGQDPVSTAEDTAVTITLGDLNVTDPDDTYPDDFTLSVQNGANYSRNGATITPANNFFGSLSVPVTVNDGLATSNVFQLNVEVTPVNDDPEITGQQALSTPEDTSITIVLGNLTVVDPDNTPAQLTLSLRPGANYTLAGNTVTPSANFNGQITVGATVFDGMGTSNVFPVEIDIDPVNDLPVLVQPIGGQNAVEASAFNLDISGNFTDVDGENLVYAAIGLPVSGNIVFNTNTGVFSGTPLFEDTEPAVYNVTVTAQDGAGEIATDTFTLTISALDRANISLDITVAPNPAMVTDELQWTFTARNPVGPQAAADVELVGSIFGSGLTVTSTDPCTIDAPNGNTTDFTCTFGALPVGGSAMIVIRTVTSEPGDVTAFGLAQGMNPVPIDPNLDDNDDQTAVGVAEVFSNGAVQVLGNSSVLSIAAGDLNGDDAADLVVGTATGQPVRIHLSDGYRDFSPTAIALPDSMSNEGVALADFDNNGTLDIVIANGGGQPDAVYGNDGAAGFSLMATLNASFAQDVAAGDFDDDGNRDLVVATIDDNLAYFGNGDGTFDAPVVVGSANSRAVAVGRMNNDSRDDIVFANIGSASEVWTKDGGGTGFTRRDQLNIGDATSVAIADLGGTPRADLLFGRVAADVGDIPANVIVINDGSGRFGSPSVQLGNAPTNDVMIGDVNNDGMMDLVFVNDSGAHQIWNSDGSGYSLHAEQIVADGARAGVLTELGFTDVGEPGGVDLAMGGTVQPGAGVYLNDGFGNLGRGDAVAPVLTLAGDNPLDVPSNTTYSDPGATATDNIDGDISSSIVVTNPVNTTVVGSYTVTYNVTDFAGNAAAPITRTVNVIPSAGSGGSGGGGSIGYFIVLMLAMAIIMSRRSLRALAVSAKKGATA